MTNFAVRPYAVVDAEACARIFDRAWHAGHPYAPRRLDHAAFERSIADRGLLVAQAVDRLLGFVAVHSPGRFVHHLYVDPSASRRGVGRALLDAALVLVGGRASLKCQLRNEAALRFYERAGWTRAETGDENGEPWVRMLSPESDRSAGAADAA